MHFSNHGVPVPTELKDGTIAIDFYFALFTDTRHQLCIYFDLKGQQPVESKIQDLKIAQRDKSERLLHSSPTTKYCY